jgi:hypothetical protein
MNACWQYQIKIIQSKLRTEIPPKEINNFKFQEISYQCAKDFIMRYEWVGNMGTSKYCYGLLFNGKLGGVVCFGPPISPTKYKKIFVVEYRDSVFQLTRGATNYWAPKWCASKLISLALTHLRNNTKYRIVVAYADPEAGEVGTIYQACNAIYLGMTQPGGSKKYIINGHTYDPRKVGVKFGSRARDHIIKIDPNFKTIPLQPKHRYIFVLLNRNEKKDFLKKISNFIQDYPKRNHYYIYKQ